MNSAFANIEANLGLKIDKNSEKIDRTIDSNAKKIIQEIHEIHLALNKDSELSELHK